MTKTEDEKWTLVTDNFARRTGITKETARSAFFGPQPVPLWTHATAHEKYTIATSTPERQGYLKTSMRNTVRGLGLNVGEWDDMLREGSERWAIDQKLVTEVLYTQIAHKVGLTDPMHRTAFTKIMRGEDIHDDLKFEIINACVAYGFHDGETGQFRDNKLRTTLQSCSFWPGDDLEQQAKLYNEIEDSIITLMQDASAAQGDLSFVGESWSCARSNSVQSYINTAGRMRRST